MSAEEDTDRLSIYRLLTGKVLAMPRQDHHPELLAFGAHMRQLRKERGLTQEKLAELAGLHRTYVGGVERGERNLALANVHALARALEVDVADLFPEAD